MAGNGGYREGAGRKKGVPNKLNRDIKAMILGALTDVGGRDYLARQAVENPGPFLTLVGKVLPMQVVGDPERPLAIEFTWAPATPVATIVDTVDTPVVLDAEEAALEIMWDEAADDAAC